MPIKTIIVKKTRTIVNGPLKGIDKKAIRNESVTKLLAENYHSAAEMSIDVLLGYDSVRLIRNAVERDAKKEKVGKKVESIDE